MESNHNIRESGGMFEQLMKEYALPLSNVAVGRRGQYMSPEEAKQIVLIELWRYANSPKANVKNLGAFLNILIQRRVLNATRPYNRWYDRNEEFILWNHDRHEPIDDNEGLSEADMRDMRTEVEKMLPQLPERSQEAVRLTLSGLEPAEVGKALGISQRAASGSISWGIKLLQEELR